VANKKSSVLVIPIKSHSERIKNKNFKVVKGKKLYEWFPMACREAKVFDRIVIDTDSDEIKQWCKKSSMEWLERKAELASNKANGNSLLRYHVQCFPEYDYYWQGFITTPFISASTIKEMHRTFINQLDNRLADSIMTVKAHRGFFWYPDGTPMNHRPEVMPRTQDMVPLYQERHGLFGITKEAFNITQCRSGLNPYFFTLPSNEDVDIDWNEDLEAANKK
jgi:CMP-N-acetylneuraminic acid synthetase